MPTYTYDTGEQPIIRFYNDSGDIKITGEDRGDVEVRGDHPQQQVNQHGNTLEFDNAQDVELHVPRGAQVEIENADGDVTISNVESIRLIVISGDVLLRNIPGTVELDQIEGDLNIEHVGVVEGRGIVGGDARVVHAASAALEHVEGDAKLQEVPSVKIGHVNGDLSVSAADEGCEVGQIDGDVSLRHAGPVKLGHVNGDLAVNHVRELHAGTIDGDCAVNGDTSTLHLGDVHGDLAVRLGAGTLLMGNVHGDAALDGAFSQITLGFIDGDLALRFQPTPGGVYRINTRGDAAITLPPESNLSLRAVVRGDISGVGSMRRHEGGAISVTYGEGGADFQLTVGGDLALRGPGNVASSTWGPDLGELNAELANLGRELGAMGREIAAAFAPSMRVGSRIGRRAGRAARRSYVNIDPEQKERIKREVRQAVQSSVEQAREAMQRALREARVTPTPPAPPAPPHPEPKPGPIGMVVPHESTANPPEQTNEPSEPVTGATVRLAPGERTEAAPDVDAERLAILRMVQEGKISPEDAEELLAALDR